MNRHENQTMKIFGKRLTAGLLGAALVMSMPFASALTQKNITVERGVTVYVDDGLHNWRKYRCKCRLG